jgi:hypothetical protein
LNTGILVKVLALKLPIVLSQSVVTLMIPPLKTVKAKYNGFEPFGYGRRRNSYLEKERLRGRYLHLR